MEHPETEGPHPDVTRTPVGEWNVEDAVFWERTGKYWSIIIVQMQNLGFTFSSTQLYTLPAIAGLAGATLRIPNSFMIAISGGRNVISITTALLIIPAAGVGIVLQDQNTSYLTFAFLAAFSGVGGGAFASSMSNISFFFPKRMQGLSLGLNAGLGNVGVSVMQVLIPWATTFAVFGALSGESRRLPAELGGELIWIQNGGLVWIPALVLFMILGFTLMNNLPIHRVVGGGSRVAGSRSGAGRVGDHGVPHASLHAVPDAGARAEQPGQPIRHLPAEAQLGNDVALHDDVRIIHRVFRGVSQAHPGRVRGASRRLDQSQRAKSAALCVARTAGRITGPASRWLDFG
jgi:hypothetical protein